MINLCVPVATDSGLCIPKGWVKYSFSDNGKLGDYSQTTTLPREPEELLLSSSDIIPARTDTLSILNGSSYRLFFGIPGDAGKILTVRRVVGSYPLFHVFCYFYRLEKGPPLSKVFIQTLTKFHEGRLERILDDALFLPRLKPLSEAEIIFDFSQKGRVEVGVRENGGYERKVKGKERDTLGIIILNSPIDHCLPFNKAIGSRMATFSERADFMADCPKWEKLKESVVPSHVVVREWQNGTLNLKGKTAAEILKIEPEWVRKDWLSNSCNNLCLWAFRDASAKYPGQGKKIKERFEDLCQETGYNMSFALYLRALLSRDFPDENDAKSEVKRICENQGWSLDRILDSMADIEKTRP